MALIFEFHLSRRARDRYQFDENMFATDPRGGGVLFADFAAARRFAERIYAVSGRLVPASDIYAMGLIDEIMHLLVRRYETQNPGVMARALAFLGGQLSGRLDQTLQSFIDAFPPSAVYRGLQTVPEYLASSTGSFPHQQVAMEEMLLLSVSNRNPALEPYREFFDDSTLRPTAYQDAVRLLGSFFSNQPPLGLGGGASDTLYEVLLAPANASPYSLEGQLQFLLDRWGGMLGDALRSRLLRAMDLVREEVIRQTGHGDFRGAAPVPSYGGEPEYERYSPDQAWMPRVVLMAKNTYVWLEQLSRKHKRWIRTLDQIPDEDLDMLASQGFTGLWLIGLWERSRASQRMKQRMGQHDAVASAYSLQGYDIAADLGGWEALSDLRARAGRRGIRLSADMVPNHMGIDSAWVMEHPDWFLSLDHSPYPSYSFQSENLADDPHVAVVLEDHYYNHTDAAVVFQRRSLSGDDVRFIYHGNDGTSFPWNDTAQLDYTRSYVREAVIQTILHVARNFPIIRFDAAMTLAKKHIQRLWFPAPGEGGAIPSRSEHGMTKAEFDAVMPNEFWREVVDRVAAEVPDTLLLAEAFWLMEGYFVRTLGMHRVYNSAFMHMLRDEDNAKYRSAIKNTLEFDPQILKRYVNFMNNPDEKTAIEQFGTGDKYFGVCTVLCTLPGLPMFGHGQIEGYREKYGMEFRMPKWDEQPDEGLVRGHEWKIFPLLHRRPLFADVEHFLLFDLYREDGHVDENVFAYSNRSSSGERGLVFYHNKFADTRGWIRISAAYLDKASGQLLQRSLAEGLDLPHGGFAICRDDVTRLEYIRSCAELWEKGLFVELHAYQHHVFLDWRFVDGSEWQVVHDVLQGSGVASVQAEWEARFARPPELTAPEGDEPQAAKKAARKKAAPSKKSTAKKTSKPAAAKSKPAAKKPATRKKNRTTSGAKKP
ncbi:MAG TPA: alpha-amylase family glycosyl hydrolase [Anaerolineales bacterium]|nr:alpha-amylase family glycosyl hydrolase [Anaerolineales bacterium]